MSEAITAPGAGTAARTKDPVDQVPPVGRLAVLGVQHVLAFYAGAVVVPLVIASGLGLDSETTIHLINADLLTCGIASIIQSAGLGPRIGVRLPLLQGVTFTAVSPLIAIGLANGGGVAGLGAMYGSIIVAGLLTFLAAPLFAKLLRFFPPVVTGTLLTIMGTTLMNVAASDIVSWGTGAAEGQDAAALTVRGLCYALLTLAVIVVVQWLSKGFVATISVLIGLVAGTLVALALGDADFSAVGRAGVVGVTTPFHFGLPRFTVAGIVSMVIVMAITAVETTGDVFATGEVVGRRITSRHIANALRADGLSTLLGGVLNSFPYTCFAQNVGLVRLSRVKSRWVVTTAGAVMIVLGLLPKAGAVVDSIPSPVIGGASLAMFASVAVVGIQTLRTVDLHDNRNSVIVSTSIGLALLVTLQPRLATMVPGWLQILFGSGVTLGAVVAIILNILFFHVGPHRTPDVAVSDGRQVDLEEINAMSPDAFAAAFALLFSGAVWPVERAAQARPFASVTALREAFEDAVLTAAPDEQKSLVNGYVDIVDLVAADADGRTADDQQAQVDVGSIALDRMDDVQRGELAAASAAYRERFGMPLVVCVANLASREQLIADAWRRVEHSPELERRVALGQVVEIAENRFDRLVADANPVRTAWSRKFEQLKN
ncbi:solute carrier family 23 protein [Propionibacterium acidifaciens]|uniref:solute carrier family 23 protein n=1 Tax=Propionibacterium acidifaciens TaxID=556499 RepID=UPI0023F1B4EE|nr:solute carrier family 23 protein [Propionibacterium acidifaciens]